MIIKCFLMFLLAVLVLITVITLKKVTDNTSVSQRKVSIISSVVMFIMTLVLAWYMNSIL